jgi:hypothetical protein
VVRVPWSTLRGIGNSAAAKATILIPLVGYLFLFNSHFVEWLQVHAAVSQAPPPEAAEAGLGWRLMCLYYGLMLVAIATVLYALTCPKVCKRYADSVEYARDVLEIHSSDDAFVGLVGELNRVLAETNRLSQHAREAASGEIRLLGSGGASAAFAALPQNERPSRVLRLLAAKYNLVDYTRPVARVLIAALYGVGLTLLAIPSANLFYRVTQSAIQLVASLLV